MSDSSVRDGPSPGRDRSSGRVDPPAAGVGRQGQAAVVATGLTRRFGDVVAVNNLSFAVGRGEIFALLGPDGAGKTTTLRMLVGAIAPTSGTVVIHGMDIARDPEAVHAQVAYMPQRFSLYEDLTVRENLDFYADLFGVARNVRVERARRLLEFSGLTAFTDRLGGNLSGGMRQKLALACALIHDPNVLLLDEPTAGVDPVSRREFWRILYELNRRGATILASTTYMDEADRCTTVGMLYAGELIATEDPGALRGRLHGEVVEFVAEPRAAAKRIVAALPGVRSFTLVGNRFHLVVENAAATIPALTERLSTQAVQVQNVETIPPSLEDVFVSMIAERRGAELRAGARADG